MDLRVYYQKLRKIEEDLAEAYVVVVSKETPDGGRAGVLTETPRRVAARMILEGKADRASAEKTKQFRDQAAKAKRTADQQAATRLQLLVGAGRAEPQAEEAQKHRE